MIRNMHDIPTLNLTGESGIAAAILARAVVDAVKGDESALWWFVGAPAAVSYRDILHAFDLPDDVLPEVIEMILESETC